MKYVLFYDSADNVATKAPVHFPAHRALRYQAFLTARGDATDGGHLLANPQGGGLDGYFHDERGRRGIRAE